MAKFRRMRRRASRAVSRSMRRFRRSSRSSSGNPMKVILPAMAYGATRGWIKDKISPVTSMVPFLGTNSDEVLMGIVGYYAAKKGRGMVKNLGMAVLTVESASLANNLVGGVLTGNSTSSNNPGWV